MAGFDAIDAALALLKDPVAVRGLHRTALPEGIPVLLAIAIGDEEVLAATERRMGRSRDVLQEAAGFYIEQALLSPSSDSYRILGGSRASTHDELRRNMALLMRWLHPDLQALRGNAAAANREVFTGRVTSAWGDLKTDERREGYDRAHPAPGSAARPAAKPASAPAAEAAPKREASRPKPGRSRAKASPDKETDARAPRRAASKRAGANADETARPKRAAARKRPAKLEPAEEPRIVFSDAASRPLFDPQPMIRREHRHHRVLGIRRIEGASLWVRLLSLFRGAT